MISKFSADSIFPNETPFVLREVGVVAIMNIVVVDTIGIDIVVYSVSQNKSSQN